MTTTAILALAARLAAPMGSPTPGTRNEAAALAERLRAEGIYAQPHADSCTAFVYAGPVSLTHLMFALVRMDLVSRVSRRWPHGWAAVQIQGLDVEIMAQLTTGQEVTVIPPSALPAVRIAARKTGQRIVTNRAGIYGLCAQIPDGWELAQLDN